MTKQDLEQGYRSVNRECAEIARNLSLYDLVEDRMPEAPREEPTRVRELHTPLFSVTN
jgi:hypothetical protein